MRIKKITVKGYRSFDSKGVEVDLPKTNHVISIIGYNNAGKSNLARAIRHAVCNLNSFADSFSESDFFNNSAEKIFIDLEFDNAVSSDPGPFIQFKDMQVIQLQVNKNGDKLESSHNFLDANRKNIYIPQATKLSEKRKQELTKDQIDIVQELYKQGNQSVYRNKEKIPFHYISFPEIHSELESKFGTLLNKKIFSLIKDFESDDNVIPDGKKNAGKKRSIVYEHYVNYLNKEVLSSNEMDSFLDDMHKILSEALNLPDDAMQFSFQHPNYKKVLARLLIYVKDSINIELVPIQHIGSGLASLIAVAMIQVILRADEGGKIIIIEEPETFLHENFQQYFYRLLNDLAENNQIILITHSKKFIDIFKPSMIVRLSKDTKSGATKIAKQDVEVQQPEKVGDYQVKDLSDFAKYLRTLEPNIGNILFSQKVLVVEGPHDLLTYSLLLSDKVDLAIRNITIVAAWGKAPILTVGQLCKRFEIECFAIHDEDIQNDNSTVDKAQTTLNEKISKQYGASNVHVNSKNLEAVLDIDKSLKGVPSVLEKLNDLSFEDIKKQYPQLISEKLERFIGIT